MNNIRQSIAVSLVVDERRRHLIVTTAVFWLILVLGGGLSALAQTPISRSLTIGQTIERELKGDEAHSYNLALTAGQYLHVVVEQKGIDVVVILFDSNGKKAAEVDSPNGTQGPEPISMIVETTGNFRLEVRSLEKEVAIGGYEVKIEELRIATKQDVNLVEAEKIFIQAELLRNQGTADSLQSAIHSYEKSQQLFHTCGNIKREALTLYTIASIYEYSLGNKQKALDYYTQALSVYRIAEDRAGEAEVLNNIGGFYLNLGDGQKAFDVLTQAQRIFNQIKDVRSEAYSLVNLGGAYNIMGNQQKSLDYFAQALKMFIQIGDRKGESNSLNSLGNGYSNLGDKQKAISYFTKSLTLNRAIGNQSGEAESLNDIGFIYEDLGERRKAVENFTLSLLLFRSIKDTESAAVVCDNLMSVQYGLNNQQFAIFYGKQSVNGFQEVRSHFQDSDQETQKSVLRSIEGIYRKLVGLLFTQNRYAEARQVLNAFKDQQFFDFDHKQQLKPLTFTPRETELLSRFDRTINDVGTISGKVAEFKRMIGNRVPNDEETKQLQQLEAQFKTAKDEFDNFIKQAETEFAAPPDDKDKVPTTADLQEMQTALRELSQQTRQKTIAVYQFVGADKYSSLLITPDSIDAISYPIKGAELNQKALQLWKLLRTPEYDPQPIANELYKIIFAPLAAKLPKDTKTILWSMDGNLRYVPMAALHDGKQYLVERFNNVIFTRADKERLTRTVSRNWTGTGLGSSKEQNVKLFDKTYKFEPLFAVETELGRMFKKANPKGIFAGDVLLDAEFTKPAMLAALKNHRPLVHIASHFKFEAGDEARSFLLLGDGSPFTLDEMKTEKDLFGGVELLTLSACQTAAQRPDATGREVDGFAELAQRLGAGAIMASLWELSDDSTAELMTRFYQTYNDGKTNKAEALRTAQLALLKGDYKEESSASRRKPLNEEDDAANIKIEKAKLRQYTSPKNAPFAHPFYWSPFVLFGNWK